MDLDETTAVDGAATGLHDHAWRKVRLQDQDDALMLGEYRCDLCAKTWAM